MLPRLAEGEAPPKGGPIWPSARRKFFQIESSCKGKIFLGAGFQVPNFEIVRTKSQQKVEKMLSVNSKMDIFKNKIGKKALL